MSKKTILYTLLYILVLSGVSTYLIFLVSEEYRKATFWAFATIIMFYILFPFLVTNGKWILRYFFCLNNDWWDKRVQRPRIFFYIMYFILLFLVLFNFRIEIKHILNIINCYMIMGYLFSGMYILGNRIWKKEFELSLLPSIKNSISDEIRFKKLSKEEINKIFEMNKSNILEHSFDDFKKMLSESFADEISNKINWIGTSGKGVVTYTGIFSLVHLIIEDGEEKLVKKRRKMLMDWIASHFVKFENGQIIDISAENLNSAYTNFVLNSQKK